MKMEDFQKKNEKKIDKFSKIDFFKKISFLRSSFLETYTRADGVGSSRTQKTLVSRKSREVMYLSEREMGGPTRHG